MYLRWFARGGECESERAFVSKTHTRAWEKTVTHEREFWVSGKRNRCIPRPRGVSRAAALVSSRTERSRTLPAFAFAGRKTTTTMSSSRYRGCFDPFVFGRKKVGKRLVSSRVAKRAGWRSLSLSLSLSLASTTTSSSFVVDDASRSDAMIYRPTQRTTT